MRCSCIFLAVFSPHPPCLLQNWYRPTKSIVTAARDIVVNLSLSRPLTSYKLRLCQPLTPMCLRSIYRATSLFLLMISSIDRRYRFCYFTHSCKCDEEKRKMETEQRLIFQTGHYDKENKLVNDKQTYQELKRDPTKGKQQTIDT